MKIFGDYSAFLIDYNRTIDEDCVYLSLNSCNRVRVLKTYFIWLSIFIKWHLCLTVSPKVRLLAYSTGSGPKRQTFRSFTLIVSYRQVGHGILFLHVLNSERN
jgi:hypothetical protein